MDSTGDDFIVFWLGDDSKFRITATSDLDHWLRTQRSRNRLVVPVAVVKADPVVFTSTTGIALPMWMSVERAAGLFGETRLDVEAQRLVFRHLRMLGVPAVRLLQRWGRAVSEVAA
jgi:hypothetical protein